MSHLGELLEDEQVFGVFNERGHGPSFVQILRDITKGESEIEVGREFYLELTCLLGPNVDINTKYKTVEHKVRPAAIPLPPEAREMIEKASKEPCLRPSKGIGHFFLMSHWLNCA